MKILIFEGIATSGKSTIIFTLSSRLSSSMKTIVYEEADTHVPIMKQTEDLHIDFFEELIGKAVNQGADVVIFDRLYLTQAFRAKASLQDYSGIETLLGQYQTTTVLLKVDEAAISERVIKASQHRDSEWADYIHTKGDMPQEIAEYYAKQQNNQLELLKHSKLPYKTFDTTDHNYQNIEDTVVAETL